VSGKEKSLSEAVQEAGVFSKVLLDSYSCWRKRAATSPAFLDYYIAYQRVSTGVRKKKKILATLVYPVLLVVVASLVVTYLVAFVVPKFGQLYRDMNVEVARGHEDLGSR